MTTEKAIRLLRRLQDEQFDGINGDERREALEMAVRALEGDGDTISRQAAMVVFENSGLDDDSKDTVVRVLEQLPSAHHTYTDEEIQKMQDLESAEIEKAYQLGYEDGKVKPHWIPCSERLPKVKPCKTADAGYEISEAVFVTRDFWHNTKVEIGYYEIDDPHRKYWVDEYGEVLCGVVAWMPLPKPYEGESE